MYRLTIVSTSIEEGTNNKFFNINLTTGVVTRSKANLGTNQASENCLSFENNKIEQML